MSDWFRCFEERTSAATRLICFPHAGGSAVFYRDWHRLASPAVEVHAVQYPGRADRLRDPLIGDARRLAETVTRELRPLLDRPVALFGHSMGSLIAYETARLLTAAGTPPVHLFVSGGSAAHDPGRLVDRVAQAPEEVLVAKLRLLGGTETEALANAELRSLVLPYLRNDFAVVESYRHLPGPALTVPVTAFAGAEDPVVRPEGVARWAELTSGDFTCHVLPGGHFFPVYEQATVWAHMHAELDRQPSPGHLCRRPSSLLC
ncbi:thioesterase II family protein [Streptomyces phaeofaciens]|jgi:surfactin synthase thioesterase subunit|uniref:thioesterase II family protein n=1 Tax=Streptomyces phaeofaciens TaxID=68254 RepID=UPI003695E241